MDDRIGKLEASVEAMSNNDFISSPKEDNVKSDDGSGQTVHSPSRVENMGNTTSSNDVAEFHFNSLNDPPQPTSEFDDGYCIYQTPTPSRINDFAGKFSAMARDGPNSPSGNQHPYGYMPVLVPGTVSYVPCWLPSWGGCIASWISWLSPPTWIWPSFVVK